ncbi:MAG: VacJ family lipoprotein [Casimicrobiaceae bacterium]
MKCNSKLLLSGLFGALCATGTAHAQVSDPIEPVNRVIFRFNDAVDRAVLRPVTEVYVKVVPSLVRRGVSNVFGNISDAFSAINNALQGKREPLGNDLGRVLVNSTFGFGGIFDIASEGNIEKSNEDFGQTLGWWGIAPGPYLVIPLLGPSNVRDAGGLALTAYLDPVNQVTPAANMWELVALRAIDTRASLLGTEDLLSGAALDKYVFVRSAYLQRRRNLVYDGKPPKDEE